MRPRAAAGKEGLAAIDQALATVAETGERTNEADLHRLRGELPYATRRTARKRDVESEAEACVRRALAIARQQGARSLELRAALALVRLCRTQPARTEEARRVLREAYGSFTEGFETADVTAARELLEAMPVRSN